METLNDQALKARRQSPDSSSRGLALEPRLGSLGPLGLQHVIVCVRSDSGSWKTGLWVFSPTWGLCRPGLLPQRGHADWLLGPLLNS